MEHFTQAHIKTKGFTMIEMLAVIAIIGILASIVLPNLSGSREKARDSERITEVNQVALALELYYNACRQYPPPFGGNGLDLTTDDGCPTGINLGSFLSEIPHDPLPPRDYQYGTDASYTSFVVFAWLEKNNAVLLDDIDGTVHTINCGNSTDEAGAGLYIYCKGS